MKENLSRTYLIVTVLHFTLHMQVCTWHFSPLSEKSLKIINKSKKTLSSSTQRFFRSIFSFYLNPRILHCLYTITKYLTKAFNTIEFQLEVKCKWCYENIKLHLTLKFEHCTIIWCLKSFSAAPLNYFSILKSFKARLFFRLHVGGQDFFFAKSSLIYSRLCLRKLHDMPEFE